LAPCLAVALVSTACQASPPPSRVEARLGVVRADDLDVAREVAEALDELLPAVAAELPDARQALRTRGEDARGLEVWVQSEPVLYVFPPTSAYRDADGFFSDRLDRIHLRADSDDVERTLAHELVHASLGRSWRSMPGTLEEGLCDVVAARLCPRSAARLRAGRLFAAAMAIGGLDIEIRAAPSESEEAAPAEPAFVQRIVPAEEGPRELDPLDVIRTRAGVSSAGLESDRKKALYGLAFLVAERIVERRGLDGFHELARRTDGRRAMDAFLAAAELTRDPEDWRRALAASIGPAEVIELSRDHPGFILTLARRGDDRLALDGGSSPPRP
jgi:hypothetical protein